MDQPKISVFGQVTGIMKTEGDIKHFMHTFEFVKLFPMKIHQNYFRDEFNVNQCYQPSHIMSIVMYIHGCN